MREHTAFPAKVRIRLSRREGISSSGQTKPVESGEDSQPNEGAAGFILEESMTDYGDMWRERKERQSKARRWLLACPHCGTKNHPELEKCRRCGADNDNFKKEQK